MKAFTELFPQIGGPFALCIGKFDGVHTGHRMILDTLVDTARKHSAAAVAYSFEPRPGTLLLTSREEKLALLESFGLSAVVLAELNEELMAMSAEQFIARIAACGSLKAVVVGEGFRFGRGAAGDIAVLRQLGGQHGFDVLEIPQVCRDHQAVSSTLIRQCILVGDVARAALLLGREYALAGIVLPGRQLARRLGFRTANILPPEGKVIPQAGVYACFVDVEGKAWPAMVNIGVKPTIDGQELLIESHLIGFEGDLYGSVVTVRLVARIRDEMKFESVEHLAAQMAKDRETTLCILNEGK